MGEDRKASSKLNRRQWALLVGSAPLLAQAPAAAPDATAVAQAGVRKSSDKLAAVEVPMNIEPAFRFTA